jgi:hypothetical protein
MNTPLRSGRSLAGTEAFECSRHDRKRVEMLFAHLKRILKLGRLRLRGPHGTQYEFTLGPLLRIFGGSPNLWPDRRPSPPRASRECPCRCLHLYTGIKTIAHNGEQGTTASRGSRSTHFCNKIGTTRTCRDVSDIVAIGGTRPSAEPVKAPTGSRPAFCLGPGNIECRQRLHREGLECGKRHFSRPVLVQRH